MIPKAQKVKTDMPASSIISRIFGRHCSSSDNAYFDLLVVHIGEPERLVGKDTTDLSFGKALVEVKDIHRCSFLGLSHSSVELLFVDIVLRLRLHIVRIPAGHKLRHVVLVLRHRKNKVRGLCSHPSSGISVWLLAVEGIASDEHQAEFLKGESDDATESYFSQVAAFNHGSCSARIAGPSDLYVDRGHE